MDVEKTRSPVSFYLRAPLSVVLIQQLEAKLASIMRQNYEITKIAKVSSCRCFLLEPNVIAAICSCSQSANNVY